MAQQVADAAPGDRHGLGAGGAAAAELGGDEGLADVLGGGVEHADGVDLEHLHREGRGEGGDGGQGAGLLRLVGEEVGGGEGQEVEGAAAGVEVEDDVGAGQELARHVVGDLLGDGAGRAAGEAAVEVAAVDRRGAGAGAEGGEVEGGDDDDGAGRASAGSRVRARSKSAIGPSYSSPWLPPVRSAVGPGPPRMTAIGIITEPQALSSRL